MVMFMLFIIKFSIWLLKNLKGKVFFSGKCASSQRSLSQSLIVCRAVNITLTFLGLVLSCVSRSLRGLRSLRSHGSHGSNGSLGKERDP